jgi:Pregnancy-associated plasma protein-A
VQTRILSNNSFCVCQEPPQWLAIKYSAMHCPTSVLSLLLLLYLPTNVLAAGIPEIHSRHCPVQEPSSALRYAHSFLSWAEPLENDLQNATTVQARRSAWIKTKRQALNPLYTINTYIHIIADNASASPSSSAYVTDAQIRAQFEYLAKSFTDASIGFRLMGYTRSTNDTWARNGDDFGMKRALRRGGYSTLNIYYQSQLQAAAGTPGIPAGSVLLGYCSLPAAGVGTRTLAAAYVLDGCNILTGTTPGGSVFGYNQGGSTVHEVGHWNGLLHTFQGNSCGTSDYGDYVADTPQEATSTNGCPTSKDSCPNSGMAPGFDGSDGESQLSPSLSLRRPEKTLP